MSPNDAPGLTRTGDLAFRNRQLPLPLEGAEAPDEERSGPEPQRASPRIPPTGLQRVQSVQKELRGKHEAKIALLAPRLSKLAFARGDYGVDSTDTRRLGVDAGIITGGEQGRALSWLAAVPPRAGLIAAGPRPEFNASGNKPMRYVHRTFALQEWIDRAEKKRRKAA